MDTKIIFEKLNDCKTRTEIETLWSETYLTYRDDAWKVWRKFEDCRGMVPQKVQVFAEAYKSYGWD